VRKAAAALLALGSVFSPARRAAKKGVEDFRAKRVAEAQRDFREAERREPDEPVWKFDVGTADAAAGETSAARAELAKAAESSDPAIAARALYQIGTLDLQAGNYPEAVNELRRSLEIVPGDADAKRNFEIAARNRDRRPPPPPKGGGDRKEGPKGEKKPEHRPDDSDFRRKAGMTKAEAEAMLRSLENEQKQKERVSAREQGKDW
jgi:tetratricopeptide (TPR) repeat protein